MDDLPIIIHMLMIYLFILDGLPFIISDFSFDSNPSWCLRGKRGHGGKGFCPQLGCDGLTVDGCENHQLMGKIPFSHCLQSFIDFIDFHRYQ